MAYLLCRSYVENVHHWRNAFRSHGESRERAGLVLKHFWCDLDKANQYFVLFEVEELDRARAYMESSRKLEADELTGVLAGEYWFLDHEEVTLPSGASPGGAPPDGD